MRGFQQSQSGYLYVQIHFLPNQRISRAQRLDLRIAERRFIHIVAGTNRTFAGHDLADKLLLILHGLPEITVEGSFRGVPVKMHLRIQVALPDDPAFPLLQIAGPPGTVQIMQGDQPVLHIGSRPHLAGAAQKNPHLPGADFGKQLFLFDLRIGIVNKGNFGFRNAFRYELLPNIFIYIEAAVPFGSGNIAEGELGELVRSALFPDLRNIFHAQIHLALGFVRQ